MNFPTTYYKFKRVLINWNYAWGKLDDNLFFHCASFSITKDGQNALSTHISIHDPDPHYHEAVGEGFGTFLNATVFDAQTVRVYIKENEKFIKQKGHCRNHKYSVSCYANVFTDTRAYHGMGWYGTETSNKHWANIIFERNKTPIVDNWEWLGIKLEDGRNIMVYNTKRKKYCCIIDDRVKRSINFWYQNNYLHIPEFDLKITLVPISSKKIFSPEVGMEYSVEPFNVLTNKSHGYGVRETTFGGVKIDKEFLYTGGQ